MIATRLVSAIQTQSPRLVRPSLQLRSFAPLPHIRSFTVSSSRWNKKYFSQDHEYLFPTGTDSVFKLGITKYAQNALGDITYVELPAEGDTFAAHDTIGTVESVKAAADILAPADGKVVKVNPALEDKPALLEDAEGEGWIAEVEITAGLDELMGEAEYKSFIEAEKSKE